MATPRVTIPELPEQTEPVDSDLLVVQDGSTTKKMRIGALNLQTSAAVDAHINNPTNAHQASAIGATANVAPMTGNNAQLQLAQASSEIASVRGTAQSASTNIAAHISDPTDAHDASAISVAPVPGHLATNVQSFLAELATDPVPNVFTPSADGLAPASGGGSVNFLRADGAWAEPPGGDGGGGEPTTSNAEVWVGPGTPIDVTTATQTVLWIDTDDPGIGGGGGGGGEVVDATPVSKGIVQLAGDLAGTAAAPTVPALATKADLGHTHAGLASLTDGTRMLDEFAGANDDAKLTAALAWQQATAGRPAIRLAARRHDFNIPGRVLYSGLKIVGTPAGPRNMELSSGNYVPTRCYLGSGIGSAGSSWWVGTGDIYDVYMADFGVQGSSGSSLQQFIDVPNTTGTFYACQFHSLSFNFMRSAFGRKNQLCALTQVLFTGHWTANNLWDTQFHLGGSDNKLWMDGMINVGVSQSPVQIGTFADNDYEIMFSSLSKSDVGYMYLTASNGWRGLKVTGGSDLTFIGGTYEGYKPTGPPSAGRAPGTVIRIEGGTGSFTGPHIGQGMEIPDPAEGGLVHITGGEWNFIAPHFFRGDTPDAVPCIYQTGGRVMVIGATRRQSETWAVRPRLETSAPGTLNVPNSGSYSTYCPDLSMTVQ